MVSKQFVRDLNNAVMNVTLEEFVTENYQSMTLEELQTTARKIANLLVGEWNERELKQYLEETIVRKEDDE